jgi:hypothetical protein
MVLLLTPRSQNSPTRSLRLVSARFVRGVATGCEGDWSPVLMACQVRANQPAPGETAVIAAPSLPPEPERAQVHIGEMRKAGIPLQDAGASYYAKPHERRSTDGYRRTS